jgi:hypothetical protein
MYNFDLINNKKKHNFAKNIIIREIFLSAVYGYLHLISCLNNNNYKKQTLEVNLRNFLYISNKTQKQLSFNSNLFSL